MVDPFFAAVVQIRELHSPAPHHPVVADHYPRHRAEENAVRRQHADERRRRGKELPRAERDADDEADVGSAADVDVAWEQTGDVHAGGEGVVDGVDGELRGYQAAAGEEGGGARLGRVGSIEPFLDNVWWVPG